MTAFMSELWRRPEEHHIHASNHMLGYAVDLHALSTFRTLPAQRKLYENWVGRRYLPPVGSLTSAEAIALVRGAHVGARLVAWGAREGDVQVGSIEDLRREQFLRARAAFKRSTFHTRLPVQAALTDMGRELDAIWR